MQDRHDHEGTIARPFTASYASIEVDPDIYIPARGSRRGILGRLFQQFGRRRLAH
ncbi:hypothetical protein ACWKWP_10630 [Agromyces soli]